MTNAESGSINSISKKPGSMVQNHNRNLKSVCHSDSAMMALWRDIFVLLRFDKKSSLWREQVIGS